MSGMRAGGKADGPLQVSTECSLEYWVEFIVKHQFRRFSFATVQIQDMTLLPLTRVPRKNSARVRGPEYQAEMDQFWCGDCLGKVASSFC